MAFTTHLLVVASQTADNDDLLSYLADRAAQGPVHVTFAVPLDSDGLEAAEDRLGRALERLHAAGVPADGTVSRDREPLHAVLDAYQPARHDEIVVATWPYHLSRWLGCDLPHRIEQATGALVHHVEVQPPDPYGYARRPWLARASSSR
jgi:hypothetical protein